MMSVPHVSILLPVRNEEEFLPAALSSLWRQTFAEWELVAVDDGSTDATPQILAEAARCDRRVRVVTQTGGGLVSALNAGLAHCRAPFVARMDGDDIAHPRRLELQYRFLADHPEVGLVACGFRHFPRHAVRLGMHAYEKWQNGLCDHDTIVRDIYVESPFVHPSVMFLRDVVMAAGGYREMGWAEDYDLWLRLAGAGVRFARLPEVLLFWRERPGRATRTMDAYRAEAFRQCKIHHLRNGFLTTSRAVALAGAGKEGRAWRKALSCAGIDVGLWIDVDPRKVGRVLHGAPVVAAEDVRQLPGKLLVTVGTRGARDGLRAWATAMGWREGEDFVCVT